MNSIVRSDNRSLNRKGKSESVCSPSTSTRPNTSSGNLCVNTTALKLPKEWATKIYGGFSPAACSSLRNSSAITLAGITPAVSGAIVKTNPGEAGDLRLHQIPVQIGSLVAVLEHDGWTAATARAQLIWRR